jgi:hypothetical protein
VGSNPPGRTTDSDFISKIASSDWVRSPQIPSAPIRIRVGNRLAEAQRRVQSRRRWEDRLRFSFSNVGRGRSHRAHPGDTYTDFDHPVRERTSAQQAILWTIASP